MLSKLRQSQKDEQRAFPLLRKSRSGSVWESKEVRDEGKGWCKERTMSIFKWLDEDPIIWGISFEN